VTPKQERDVEPERSPPNTFSGRMTRKPEIGRRFVWNPSGGPLGKQSLSIMRAEVGLLQVLSEAGIGESLAAFGKLGHPAA
jgi:hypothetical protein